jgi:choline/glycine/proline betaine transport protein
VEVPASQTKARADINPNVFFGSVGIILVMLLAAVVATKDVEAIFGGIQDGIVHRFGWFYIAAMTGFLVFAVWLTFSRFGHIRLGPDDSRPSYSLPSWFSMLFSAGMGIGLLFFSVAEPMQHYMSPPKGRGESFSAARDAMGLTFFHWGLHPWGVYALIGLSLAYFSFRKGGRLSLRSALVPLLGKRAEGRIGDLVDILAVVGTLFGVATSLGLGAMQVNAGLAHVAGIGENSTVQMIIIACITAAATMSVVSGLDAGVKKLSEINMGLAGLLLLFVLIAGPTAFLLNAFVENIGNYLQHLPKNSFWTASFEEPERRQWLGNWTVFYWAWWIAWAPFVGMFIARVSRGRTIREFMLGVLLAPTLAGFVWLTIFGDSALHVEVFGEGGIAAAASEPETLPTAIFLLLEQYPLSGLTAAVCTLCIILFFVTSSDSASLVVDTIASGGNEEPPVWQRIFWAVLEGVIAAVLLWAGGLEALQTAAITAALPFSLVIIAMCVALVAALRKEVAAPG